MSKSWAMLCGICCLSLLRIAASCEEPQKVTVCQLQHDPPAFNHKLVQLEAFVSWGFEDFTLFDPNCYVYPQIWLEYGGKVNSGTIYFGPGTSQRKRNNELIVQGIPIPLVDDDRFKEFDKRIHHPGPGGHGPPTRAQLIGRFFAGRKETYPSGESAWSGFGHFGCCTLLAVQQATQFDSGERAGLDPYGIPLPMIAGFNAKVGAYRSLLPEDICKYVLDSQSKAEDGSRSRAFDDPKRVAFELINEDLHGKLTDPSALKETQSRLGFKEYELKIAETGSEYLISVSHPDWLSFYARDSKKVAWVAIYATVSTPAGRPALKSPIR